MTKDVSTVEECLLGIDDLDRRMGKMPCKSLMAIVGHPGAGKTTFAAQLVFRNAIELGRKSLYITLYEDRETLIDNIRNSLEIDLSRLEREGYLRVVSPSLTDVTDPLDYVTSLIAEDINNFNPSIIVIDSLTPLLEYSESRARARAFIHSVLYQIAHKRSKLVVVIIDLPWGREYSDLGGIEFIADALFILKTRVEHRKLTRWMEIRKFRGKMAPLLELPFTIVPRAGIQILTTLVSLGITAKLSANSQVLDNSVSSRRIGSIKSSEGNTH